MCSLPTWAFQVRGSPYILNILFLFQNLFETLNKYILNISRPIRNISGPPVLPGFLKTLPGTLPGARNDSGIPCDQITMSGQTMLDVVIPRGPTEVSLHR